HPRIAARTVIPLVGAHGPDRYRRCPPASHAQRGLLAPTGNLSRRGRGGPQAVAWRTCQGAAGQSLHRERGTRTSHGLTLHYMRAGSGPALLLLHGIGSNSRSFRHQLADLSDGFDLIAWDAPGYGQSSDPADAFTLENLADRAVALLDELEIQRAHVLGVSMGGVIAQLVG